MDRHPIESLMGTTMENIRDMVDVNTVVGDPVETAHGVTVIPISRVSFGFVAGGGEYSVGDVKESASDEKMPFAGGSGAGVSVQPMGFLIASESQVRLLSANCQTPIDRVVELIPQMIGNLKSLCEKDEAAETSEPSPDKKQSAPSEPYAFPAPDAPITPAIGEIRAETPRNPS